MNRAIVIGLALLVRPLRLVILACGALAVSSKHFWGEQLLQGSILLCSQRGQLGGHIVTGSCCGGLLFLQRRFVVFFALHLIIWRELIIIVSSISITASRARCCSGCWLRCALLCATLCRCPWRGRQLVGHQRRVALRLSNDELQMLVHVCFATLISLLLGT